MPTMTDQGGFWIAENATVIGAVTCARGVSIWYGAVVRGDMATITIGEGSNIQDNGVLHCDPGKDMVVGKYVTIGHHAMVHAQEIGDRSLIGIGAILLGGTKIGEGALIAAGALVREDHVIPPRSIVVGVPGKIIGQTTDAQIQEFEIRAKRYGATALRHAQGKGDPRYMQEYP